MFASDNSSGIHPRVLEAIARANQGHAVSYGADEWTERAHALLRSLFGAGATPFLTFNGTGANVLGLSVVTPPYGSIVCTDCSHVATDECGAPERILGAKVSTVDGHLGKLSPDQVERFVSNIGVQHHNQPRVVSVTQPTELGTLYEVAELREIAAAAHAAGMRVHMDGARLANACAALDMEPRTLTADVGVDVLSFGLTKNGAMGAEAVIVFDAEIARDLAYQRKQQMQLASKMRFLAAQFVAMLEDDLWLRNAANANRMATRLADGIESIERVAGVYPVQANAVFAEVPHEMIASLQERHYFYVWEPDRPTVRWMASYDTTDAVVDDFVQAIREEGDAL